MDETGELTPDARSGNPRQTDRQRENEILAASAYPVAVTAQAVAEADSDTDKVRTAAGQLLAAGVSLRTSAPGEAMLESVAGGGWSGALYGRPGLFTARRSPSGIRLQRIVVDTAVPLADYVRTPPTATPTTAQVHELMRTVSRNLAWRMTGFTNTRLRAQRRTAERLDKLHRELSLWIRSLEADAPFPGRRARRRLTTLAMIRLDCGARTTAERNDAGEVTSLTIKTGPDPDIAIDCGLDATIITPAAHCGIAAIGIAAVWTARPARSSRNVHLSSSWKTLEACNRHFQAHADLHGAERPTWEELLQRIATHPYWKALTLPDARNADDRSWEPWPDATA